MIARKLTHRFLDVASSDLRGGNGNLDIDADRKGDKKKREQVDAKIKERGSCGNSEKEKKRPW